MADNTTYKKISRRSFLKASLAAGGAIALAGCGETVVNTVTVTETVPQTVTVTEKVTNIVKETVTVTEKEIGTMPSSKHIVFNQDFCTGCATCVMACSVEHFGEFNKKLGALRMDADFYNHEFNMYLCSQCESASCVAACPDKVSAFYFDENTGARCIDMDKCTLCGKCVEACPYGSDLYPPIHMEALANGEEVLVKCDLCRGRAAGPACVEKCFFDALTIEG